MGKKKQKADQQNFQAAQIYSDSSVQVKQEVLRDNQICYMSPRKINTRNYQALSTAANKKKSKNFANNHHPSSRIELADLKSPQRQVKLETIQGQSFMGIDPHNEIINAQKPKPNRLPVRTQIKAYYELVELAETLDVLVIKHYKDPLLSSITVDFGQQRVRNIFQVLKAEHRDQSGAGQQRERREFIAAQSVSQPAEGSQVLVVKKEAQRNFHKSENSQDLNSQGGQNIHPNQLHLHDESNSSEFKVVHVKREDKRIEEDLWNVSEILDNPFDFKTQIVCQIPKLQKWLAEVAVYIEDWSAAQFRKLMKLKKALLAAQAVIDKAIKEQLFQIYPGLRKCKARERGQQRQADGANEQYHVCRICWQFFQNGHQLGGHMSKKHPGHSLEYRNKELIKARKVIERQRRQYFKMLHHLARTQKKHPSQSRKNKQEPQEKGGKPAQQ